MTFALYFTVANRNVWNRLAKEVREKFNSEEEITGPSTQNIPYLTAIISECTPSRFLETRSSYPSPPASSRCSGWTSSRHAT